MLIHQFVIHHLKQQTYRACACILALRFFLLMINDTTERDKEKQKLYLGGKGSLRVTKSKELAPQILSRADLNLEREKRDSYHSPFHQILQADIQEADVVRNLTFSLPLSDVQDPSAIAASGWDVESS